MCILTCAHREARHGCTCTRTTPLYTCTNCTKPQLDIHGVPTLTISSIVGTANMCSGSPPFIDFRTSRQKSSGDRFFNAFRFFSFLLFFFFLLYARHWKLVYWVIREIINAALKNTRFFFDVVIFVFLLFFSLFLL